MLIFNSSVYLWYRSRQPKVELVKDIFFFIGSALGIFAFMKTLVEPAFADNRQKWEALKEHLTEQDLINLQHQVYVSRRVRDELLDRVIYFVHDIEEDAEYLRFGPPFRGLFEEHKKGLISDFRCLIERVQVPYWRHNFFEDGDERESYWSVDKNYFYEELPAAVNESDSKKAVRISEQAYENNLNEASDAVDRMRMHYRAIGILANLHAFEAPFARGIVKKRSRLPER
jgi:hypothetical protein